MLIHGDCLDVLPTLPDASVDMVFADLPYGVTANKWDCVIPFEPLWEQLLRVGKLNAAILFTATQPFATTLIASNKKMFRYDMIWEKPHATGFFQAKTRPMRAHENICIFYKNQPTYNPQMIAGEPYRRGGTLREMQNLYGRRPLSMQPDKPVSAQRFPRSVLKIRKPSKNSHPSQKPVALIEWLIKTYTNEGDTVLDPTCGSATTAIAALNTGREYICIEKDTTYYDVAARRIASHQIVPKQAQLDFCRSKR